MRFFSLAQPAAIASQLSARWVTVFWLGLSTLIPLSGCADDQSKEASDFISSIGPLPPKAAPSPSEWKRVGDTWVRDQLTAIAFDKLILLDSNASTVWPGAIVAGKSLGESALTPIALPRAPLTLTVSNVQGVLEGAGRRPLSVKVESPTFSNVTAAISNLLAQVDPKTLTPQISFNKAEFQSLDQAFSRIGIAFKSVSVSVRASLASQSYETRQNIMWDFAQRYYTVSIDAPSTPAGLFKTPVSKASLSEVAGPGNPPVYVNDVAFGRRVVLLFSSSASMNELQAALSASYNALFTSGGLDVGGETKKTFSQTELRVLVVGGSSTSAAELFAGDSIFPALKNYLKDGATLSTGVSAAPLSFKATYLRDNSVADVQLLSIDRQACPAVDTRYYLRWYNHLEPNVLYKVVGNMVPGGYGGKDNERYKPFVQRLSSEPGQIISITEVAGDEQFKAVPANSWTAPPMNCPSLLQDGLGVMDDERWYLVQYRVQLQPPP